MSEDMHFFRLIEQIWRTISDITVSMWAKKKKTIKVFFVLTDDRADIKNMSESMQLALQDCYDHELTTSVVEEAEVCKMNTFKKSQVFVFDNFEGVAFHHVLSAAKQNEAVIVSPLCLRTCFVEAISIPENKSPVYTLAMRDVVLSASNISPQEKERVKEKFEYMGGVFTHNLRDVTTHLMVGKVGSAKYTKAVELGLSIMTENWVEAVWEESLERNIVGTESMFDKYKCPLFYNLQVTTSGLDANDRDKISALVNKYGGKYSPQMKKGETDVLILLKPTGQKFVYAQQWGLKCVNPSWIYDSTDKGHLVEPQDYIVKNTMLSSTPAISNVQPSFSQSDISEIVAEPKSTIEETMNDHSVTKRQATNNCRTQDDCTTPKKNNGQFLAKNINYKAILNSLNLTDVKKAGTILDGCKIYFSGFNSSEEEKLKRIVISTGGIRYTELSESVTHILVGDFTASLAKLLHSTHQKPHVVTLNWIIESVKLKCTAPEEQFLAMDASHTFAPESPSPLSKKGLFMMKNKTLSQAKVVEKPKPSTSVVPDPRPTHNDFIDQYLNADSNNSSNNDTQSQRSTYSTDDTLSTQDSRLESVLEGLTILMYGLDPQQMSSVKTKIIAMGGTAVSTRSHRGKFNYAVVPIVFNEKSLTVNAEIVSCLWIEDCFNNVDKVTISYYHKPVIFSGSAPLKNCVISVTNYAGSERYFLKEVSLLLGAHYQDALSRKPKLEDNILVTTHLICPNPEGPKYEASVKWGIPVVSKDWLLDCIKFKNRLPETQYPIIDKGNETLTGKSTVVDITTNTSSRNLSQLQNLTDVSLTPRVTNSEALEKEIESELAVPLQDTEDFEPPTKKKCSIEMNPTPKAFAEDRSTPIGLRARPKSSCLTPVASGSYMTNLKTPDTPYGQVFYEHSVTPETKKRWKKWVDTLPDGPKELPPQPSTSRRESTPLTELKRRVWDKLLHPSSKNEEIQSTDNNSSYSLNNSRKSNLGNSSDSSPNLSRDSARSGRSSVNKSPTIDSKQQSLDKQEFRRTMEELQQDLSTPREQPELNFSRIESIDSQDDHARNSLFKERVIESSQQCSVGWEDPTEQQEKARLKRLTECNRKFILTSVNANERQKYEDAIEKLGAQVLRSATFSGDVTHVLMHQPSRSEKYLCSLASGKWILHPSYIDACLEKNRFLPEDKYEWGNPLSDLTLTTPLHGAGYRWRNKLCADRLAAFSNMKAVLLTSEPRHQALSRLIQAGGGVILDIKDLLNSTHCIVDQGHGNIPVPLNEIAAKGILLLPALFLADFLIKDPIPDPKQCLIPEYQAFYNRLAPNS
ncbi:DNA topoisomerase 2-binding protein 1 isoform X2 [Adelges cooleyi]|uniref:DNA topoisomerase 2-binding protein 1 isoform X2 n=1 Tax=Adelges cooleyi TaxID=133065 RepID=UPI0021803C97|nr:DNA topoisomerase 2-binding protein 1 isoform X2 [Adelges cooleyi]